MRKAAKQISLRTCARLDMVLGVGLFEEMLFELPRMGKSRRKRSSGSGERMQSGKARGRGQGCGYTENKLELQQLGEGLPWWRSG